MGQFDAAGHLAVSRKTAAAQTVDTAIAGGVWTWFCDPRAFVDDGGETFVTALTDSGEKIVAIRNGAVTQESGYFTAVDETDDHNNPALIRLQTDTFLLGFSDHSFTRSSWLYLSSDTTITAWQTAQRPLAGSEQPTYTYLHELTSEDSIYYFYRSEDGNSHVRYMRVSGDGGRTWSARDSLLFNNNEAPYIISRTFPGESDKIHFLANSSNPGTGTPASAYYFYYQRDSFFLVDGSLLATKSTLPILTDTLDAKPAALVWDAVATGDETYPWDIHVTDAGSPVLAWQLLVDLIDGNDESEDNRYYFSKWNGSSWENTEICAAGYTIQSDTITPARQRIYAPGITFLDENKVFLGVNESTSASSGTVNLYRYVTLDNGDSWIGTRLFNAGGGYEDRHIRPYCPDGATQNSEITIFWLGGYYEQFYNSYYEMNVLYGKY